MKNSLLCFLRRFARHPVSSVVLAAAGVACGVLADGFLARLTICIFFIPAVLLAVVHLSGKPDALGWRIVPEPPLLKPDLHELAVDSRLIVTGSSCVRHAALPFVPEPALRLRAHSGALLLATAATFTCAQASEQQRAGLVAALAPLGFSPERMTRLTPVLGQADLGPLHGPLTRDGQGKRAYFMADPLVLAALCPYVYDGGERPMTDGDRASLAQTVQSLRLEGEQPLAFAMASFGEGPLRAVFLGILSLGDELAENAALSFDLLRSHGVSVAIDVAGDGIGREALCHALGVSAAPEADAVHVCYSAEERSPFPRQMLPPHPGDTRYAQALVSVLDHRRRLSRRLRQTAVCLCALLPVSLLLPAPWWIFPMLCLLLVSGMPFNPLSPADDVPPARRGVVPRMAFCLIPAAVCLLTRAFLRWSNPLVGVDGWLVSLLIFGFYLSARQSFDGRGRAFARSIILRALLLAAMLVFVALDLRIGMVRFLFACFSAAAGCLVMHLLDPPEKRS